MSDLIEKEEVKALIKSVMPKTPYRSTLIHMVNTLESAKEPQEQTLESIDMAITATNANDAYSVGMKNGMRYVKYLIDGKNPEYEEVKQQDVPDINVGDLISRKKLIDDLREYFGIGSVDDCGEVAIHGTSTGLEKVINNQPQVQQIVRTPEEIAKDKELQHYKDLAEQGRLVDIDDVISVISNHHFDDDKSNYDMIIHNLCKEMKQLAKQLVTEQALAERQKND